RTAMPPRTQRGDMANCQCRCPRAPGVFPYRCPQRDVGGLPGAHAQQRARTQLGGLRMSVIVVGYSAKPEGQAALDKAIDEAGRRRSQLVVVHTLESQDDV